MRDGSVVYPNKLRTEEYVDTHNEQGLVKYATSDEEEEEDSDIEEAEEEPAKTSEVIEIHGSSSEEGEITDSDNSSEKPEVNEEPDEYHGTARRVTREERSSLEEERINQYKKICKRHHQSERHTEASRKKHKRRDHSRGNSEHERTNVKTESRSHRSHDSRVLLENVRIKVENVDDDYRGSSNNHRSDRKDGHIRKVEEDRRRDAARDRRRPERDERPRRSSKPDIRVKEERPTHRQVTRERSPHHATQERPIRREVRERSPGAPSFQERSARRGARERSPAASSQERSSRREMNERSHVRPSPERPSRREVSSERSPPPPQDRSRGDRQRMNGRGNNRPGTSNGPRRRENEDGDNFEWGQSGSTQPQVKEEPQDKDKPDFKLSGKLAEETNVVNGVLVKYTEPPEARMPKKRWRLYPFKGDEGLPALYIHRQSAYLIGRDRKVADLPVDHPSCSKQHAALQYRLVTYERNNGRMGKAIRLYIIDLESANGTFLNNKKIEAKKYHELREKDVIKFGFSSREYVLLHEGSKDEDSDVE